MIAPSSPVDQFSLDSPGPDIHLGMVYSHSETQFSMGGPAVAMGMGTTGAGVGVGVVDPQAGALDSHRGALDSHSGGLDSHRGALDSHRGVLDSLSSELEGQHDTAYAEPVTDSNTNTNTNIHHHPVQLDLYERLVCYMLKAMRHIDAHVRTVTYI